MKNNKKKYHHGDLKPALVRAGLQIVEEAGLEGLSLRAIAARVGVSHTAPKNHFDGLNGLLAAIAAEGFRMHAAAMRHGVEGTAEGRERLEAAAQGYVRFAQENPALFRLMFSLLLKEADYPELSEAAMESYCVLRDISEGLDWPSKAPQHAPCLESLRTEMMLWTFVHGYSSLLIDGRGPRTPEGDMIFGVLEVMPFFNYR